MTPVTMASSDGDPPQALNAMRCRYPSLPCSLSLHYWRSLLEPGQLISMQTATVQNMIELFRQNYERCMTIRERQGHAVYELDLIRIAVMELRARAGTRGKHEPVSSLA